MFDHPTDFPTMIFSSAINNASILILALGCAIVFGAVALADELHLKDGRVIEAEEIWELGDAIWYRQGKIIASFAKTDVVRITKPKPEPSANSPANPAGTGGRILTPAGASAGSATGDEVVSRKISRIILKGGTQIDADAVWPAVREDSDRVG